MPRYILTGAPGAGKTAILRLLETSGTVVVEEAATDVIALSHALGRDEPWRDRAFIDTVISLQRHRQDLVRLAGNATVFFDRSPVCTLALSLYLGFTSTGMSWLWQRAPKSVHAATTIRKLWRLPAPAQRPVRRE
jgi:predicted ATPase